MVGSRLLLAMGMPALLAALLSCGLKPSRNEATVVPRSSSPVTKKTNQESDACPEIPAESTTLKAEASRILNTKCADCHNRAVANGGIAFDFDVEDDRWTKALAQGLKAIQAGRMPPNGRLIDQCEENVLGAVQQKPEPESCIPLQEEPNFANAVRVVTDQHCIGCHKGADSKGGVDFSITPTDSIAEGALARQIKTAIDSGRMPPGDPTVTACQKAALDDFIKKQPNPPCADIENQKLVFETHVTPIILGYCGSCHGPNSARDLTTLKDPRGEMSVERRWSQVLTAVKGKAMPPNGPELGECEIKTIEVWLNQYMDESPLACAGKTHQKPLVMNPLNAIELQSDLSTIFPPSIMKNLTQELTLFPSFSLKAYDGEKVFINQDLVFLYKTIAEKIESTFRSNLERLKIFVGCEQYPDQLDNEKCLKDFIAWFGLATHRRPLTPEEITEHFDSVSVLDSTEDRYLMLISTFLQSAEFIYKIDPSKKPSTEASIEVASRLAYNIWKVPPDRPLLEKALKSDLTSPLDFKLFVDGMMQDPRARKAQELFFVNLLEVYEGPPDPYAPYFLNGVDGDTLFADAYSEFVDFVGYIIDTDGSINDLYTSRVAKVSRPNLSKIYNVPLSRHFQLLPADFNTGILGRTANLLQPGVLTSPIRRGRKIRERLLCDSIGPKPALSSGLKEHTNAGHVNFLPNRNGWKGMRELAEERTANSECMACHIKMNHLGFALEGFDSLGRHRDFEKLYIGQEGGYEPIDLNLKVRPQIVLGEQRALEGIQELSDWIANHKVARRCISQMMFQFIFEQHNQNNDDDRCLIERTQTNQPKDTLGLRSMYKDFILRSQGIVPDSN